MLQSRPHHARHMMRTPAKARELPSLSDMIRVTHTLDQLTTKLGAILDASEPIDAGINETTEDCGDMQTWVTPISKIPFEILSEIFVIAAELVWWSPMINASVCRLWRDVALATPRAWRFIDLRSEPPLSVTLNFFERSGRHLLHLTVPAGPATAPLDYATIVGTIPQRVRCLVLTEASQSLLLESYPKLTNLSVTYPRVHIPLRYLDGRRFPKLRYVDASFTGISWDASLSVSLPPIVELTVRTDRHGAWLALIPQISKTLVKLHIIVTGESLLSQTGVGELPRLKHLKISTECERVRHWFFDAKTPSLISYNTIEGDGIYTINVNVGLVTHLQCWDAVTLSPYGSIRHLAVVGFHCDVEPALSIVDQICENPTICMDLERIVLGSWDFLDTDTINARLQSRREYTGIDIKIEPIGSDNLDWPGAAQRSCGPRMPCNF